VAHYLISFDDGAMDFPEEEWPAVGIAAHEVDAAAREAGVRVFSGGLTGGPAIIVGTDGSVTDGPDPETRARIGGFMVVDVPSREIALSWAAKVAAACRCAQEVRPFAVDGPE
jgi:hypothetical protein